MARLPEPFHAWEDVASQLPDLLLTRQFDLYVRSELPVLVLDQSISPAQLDRAMLVLSFLGTAAVWQDGAGAPRTTIPACIAVPWCEVARQVGRPPTLAYASHALTNWRRLSLSRPIALDNLAPQFVFLGGLDERWFIVSHLEIEARAAAIPPAVVACQAAVAERSLARVIEQLERVLKAQQEMYRSLLRLPERCDPLVFHSRIQPFLGSFPSDLTYEGATPRLPTPLAGASAAQSSILSLLDAFLGVEHVNDAFSAYLIGLRQYSPPTHRAFVDGVLQGASLRELVLAEREPRMVEVYNECITELHQFRAKHVELAVDYIARPAKALGTSVRLGTGGTLFMGFLKKLSEETQRHRV